MKVLWPDLRYQDKSPRERGQEVLPCPTVHSATIGTSSWSCDPSLQKMWRSAEHVKKEKRKEGQKANRTKKTVYESGFDTFLLVGCLFCVVIENKVDSAHFIKPHWENNEWETQQLFEFQTDLLAVGADLDGIWDELGCLLLGQRGHIFQQNGDL